jgi:3-hydroxyacyl-[acyl-carrier-protein] dehydratase
MTDQDKQRGWPDAPVPAVEYDKDVCWIMSLIPHRYPFLLVDRVVELERRKRIVATKNVTFNEEVLQGHFPGHPVYPGVLVIEGMAQAGTILLMRELDDETRHSKLLYFSALERARFRRPVVPGDQIRYEIEVLRWRPGSAGSKLEAKALVDGKVAAEARISSVMVDR